MILIFWLVNLSIVIIVVGYGYSTQKPAAYTATSAYQKPQGYATASSSYNSGYSAGQRAVSSQSYSNPPYAKQKVNKVTGYS